ncbi:MAG TPA: cytochrome c3 family protein [Pirellulaceae bacterium]|nr:cytochrome c3 family protein [Pirellulaceae bacterium]
MPQVFHPSTNTVARASVFGGLFLIAAVVYAGNAFLRSSYVTQADVVRDQPVPFSHDHHVAGLGIDCRYCHSTVETAAFAGMPSTEVCMGCHSQIWKDSPLLAPVRESYAEGKPLAWTRVYDVPDFVYFDHSIHVAKGIACQSCHGPVDRMPLMRKATTLHMEWCLACHRHPELAVREREDMFKFERASTRQAGTVADGTFEIGPRFGGDHELANQGQRLVQQYGIVTKQLTDCVICHR